MKYSLDCLALSLTVFWETKKQTEQNTIEQCFISGEIQNEKKREKKKEQKKPNNNNKKTEENDIGRLI